MTELSRSIIICVFIMIVITLNGQNSCLDKTVHLPKGPVTLKVALKTLGEQAGCVFSYDPVKLSDKQMLKQTSKESLSLRIALQKILPKEVQFKLHGKYIVLHVTGKNGTVKETTLKETSKHNYDTGLNSKKNGLINKKTILERLVLPPVSRLPDTVLVTQSADTIKKPEIVAVNFTPDITVLQKDSTSRAPVILKESILSGLANEIMIKDTQSVLNDPVDSSLITKPDFDNFIKKNGFLEMGLTFNKKISAISVRTGLYNVYSILSIGSDNFKSYLLGVGVGVNIKINNHFGFNFDLLRNSLVAGKSYLLEVRASNTQFTSVLNYTFGGSYKVFAGPTLNLIKSSYVSSISTTDLGLLAAIGLSVGVKVDLKYLIIRKK